MLIVNELRENMAMIEFELNKYRCCKRRSRCTVGHSIFPTHGPERRNKVIKRSVEQVELYLLKLVVPLFDVGDTVDQRHERFKPSRGSDASPAHDTAVGDAFTRRHREHSYIVAVLVVSEREKNERRKWFQVASALPVAAARETQQFPHRFSACEKHQHGRSH